MSYCRFSKESGVYMYGEDAIRCCGCSLAAQDRDPRFKRYSEAIIHLRTHVVAGDLVPDRAFQQLKADQKVDGDVYLEPI